jgi:hypothetical protein
MQTIEQMLTEMPPDRLVRVNEALEDDHKNEMPSYLRFIIAVGAWLASIFFIACGTAFFGWEAQHKPAIGATGIVILVASIVVNRFKLGLFIEQFALALSLAGQGMIYYGFIPDSEPGVSATDLSIAMAIVLYVAYPSFLSRLITCVAAFQITLWWLHLHGGDWVPWLESRGTPFSATLFAYWLFHLALLGICLIPARYERLLAPLGYATAISLACWQFQDAIPGIGVLVSEIPKAGTGLMHFPWRAIVTAMALLGVAIWSAGGLSRIAEQQVLFTAIVITLIVLMTLGATGVVLSLLLMLLGFSLGKRPLLALGLLLLGIFLVDYYYSLEANLLTKSLILVASGAALLALRTVLIRFAFSEEVA